MIAFGTSALAAPPDVTDPTSDPPITNDGITGTDTDGYNWFDGSPVVPGMPDKSVSKLPVPATPQKYPTSAAFGQTLIGWGSGPLDAVNLTNNMDASTVCYYQSEGATRDMVVSWRDFYSNESLRNANNMTAKYRVPLLQKILDIGDQAGCW